MQEIEFLEDDFLLVGDKVDITKDEVAPARSSWKDCVSRFFKNKGAVAGLCCIFVIVVLAVFVPVFSTYEYDAIDSASANIKPCAEHLFGTDAYGRDLFVRCWQGTRISLFVAVVAVIIDVVIGMVYGLISGYFGGALDNVMQRFQEIVNSIPTLVILTLLLTVLKASLYTVIFALMFTEWIAMSRITRAQVLKVKEDEYVLASRTLGASHGRLIFKEILPNIYGQLIIMSMMTIPNAIFYEAYLAVVGLGLAVPEASLGTLINEGYNSFLVYPYMMLIPAIILAVLMLSFNLFGDGLRDALDPTMKER